MTNLTFSIINDTLDGVVCAPRLTQEIEALVDSYQIPSGFDGVRVDMPDTLMVLYNTALNQSQIDTITNAVAMHDGNDCFSPETDVSISTGYPITSNGYDAGDRFIDTQTGRIFMFNGVSWSLLNPSLDGYAFSSDLSSTNSQLSSINSALQSTINDLDSYVSSSEKGIVNGIATLDSGGKIPVAQLPATSLPEVHVVSDETARLVLDVQEGDEAIQTDNGYHYIYDGYNWYLRPSGSGDVTGPGSSTNNAVALFDGTTGKVIKNSTVTVDASGNISVPGTVDGRDIADDGSKLDTIEISAKDDQTITAGTGLTGGGTGDVTLNVDFGTTSGKVTQGNDSSIPSQAENDALAGTSGSPSGSNRYVTNSDSRNSDARTPTAHKSTHEDGGSDELTAQDLGSGSATSGKIMETDGSGGWSLIDTPSGGSSGPGVITFSEKFFSNGGNSNTWMEIGDGAWSNRVRMVVPWDCNLIAITFANRNTGVDVDVEIYKRDYGQSNKINILAWDLNNIRTAYKSNISVSLSAGDELGVYLKDRGSNPNDPVVTLYFQVNESASNGTGSQNISGNF